MERLHTLDAEFLYLESPSAPMHIGSINVFEGPPPSRQALMQLYSAKLAQFPRYRQRARMVPLELGRPVWLDDPGFDLAYHLRWTALADPGDYQALCTLAGRVMAQMLDRERPLWETWVVEGLAGGRWALLSKIHHAMVDGVSGTGLLIGLLDEVPSTDIPAAAPWRPQEEPSAAAMIASALRDQQRERRALGKKVLESLRDPTATLRAGRDLGLGLARLTGRLLGAPDVSLQGALGRHRHYAFASVRLDDIQRVRQVLGGTVNDVVLAALSGAYRVLLTNHGDDVREPIRSLVPVSVRRPGQEGALDNQVSAVICDLPVHLSDPVERLKFVSEQMDELKRSHMAEASAFLCNLGDLSPAPLVSSMARTYGRLSRALPQRAFSTVTTNVPGPRKPLYLLGRRMLAYYPYVPVADGMRVGTAILSYAGQVTFGITADYDTVPDIELLARAIEANVEQLALRARAAAASSALHAAANDAGYASQTEPAAAPASAPASGTFAAPCAKAREPIPA